MAYFTKGYIDFFKNLEKNNSKEWMDENRKVYEKEVKEPFKIFATDFIAALEPVLGMIPMTARQATSRINRDIRFSKDKTPYNIFLAATVAPGGKKDMTNPGIYLQMNHKSVACYSGAYALDKYQLQGVREYMIQNLEELEAAISDKEFVATFGEIHGDKNKRIPKEFREAAEKQPLFLNKHFYYFFKLDPKLITQDDLIPQVIERFKKSEPMASFLRNALAYAAEQPRD